MQAKITYYFSGEHLSNTLLTNNAWNHVVLSVNAGNIAFYLNGKADGTASGAPSFIAATMGTDSSDEAFKGALDDVRLYNRALSATEIKQLYNAER